MNRTATATRRSSRRSAAIFPAIQSILDPGALREHVARAYALPAPVECSLLHRGRNDTYLISTPSESYIARVYGAWWRSASEVAYELAVLRHLAARGVPVAGPVADRAGAVQGGLPAPEGERQLALFVRLPGRALSWTPDDAERAGELLARIHAATDDFHNESARPQLDLDYLIDASLSGVEPFLAHRPADWAYLRAAAGRLRARAEEAIADGMDWGVCHGDYSSGNIHITPEGQLTVFDFDFCGPGWRVYDFVDVRRKARAEKQEAIWERFLGGYTAVRPLGRADRAMVAAFVAIGHLRGLGHHSRSAAIHGSERMADWYLDWELGALREWESLAGAD